MRCHVLPLVLACGCATDVASKSDVRALTEQVQALQKQNAQLQSRLTSLEHERALAALPQTPPASPTPASIAAAPVVAAAEPAHTQPPALTVVKLKPKAAAPPVDTLTPVQEPDRALIEALETQAEPVGAAAPPSSAADQEYQGALEALRTGNVTGAVERLKRFADNYPRHPKADDALYYAALGELGQGEVAQSALLLQVLVQRYPAGDVVQDAMLKLGEVRLRLKQPAEARAAYALLVQNFPGTAAAVQAQARLDMLSRNP
jgi:TolA-binding protein